MPLSDDQVIALSPVQFGRRHYFLESALYVVDEKDNGIKNDRLLLPIPPFFFFFLNGVSP